MPKRGLDRQVRDAMTSRPIPSDWKSRNVRATIGNTPLVRLNRVTAGLAPTILAKVEFFNPGGSVKDRIGWEMVEDFERRGLLKPGGMVVECTSGNTGVGLAMACVVKGYRATFTMPDKMSLEKIRLLKAFGARVIVTPTAVPPESPESYYSVARQIVAETPGAVHTNQYDNQVNPAAHYRTTGPETAQTRGRIDSSCHHGHLRHDQRTARPQGQIPTCASSGSLPRFYLRQYVDRTIGEPSTRPRHR